MPRDPHDIQWLRERRQQAARVKHVLRVDLGLGIAIAIVALLVLPGLAYAAIAAGVLLIACAVAWGVARRRRRRGGTRGRSPRVMGRTGGRRSADGGRFAREHRITTRTD